MRNSIDQLIDLAKVFVSDISLTKDIKDRYLVSIRRVSYKENRNDCMIRGISGRGESVEEACRDFLSEAKGKLLVGDDSSYYGENRPEYLCV